tara:strand:- start:989 stop:1300 length:312 start_codon:yes stop_codon:yes gene_type:complete
MIRLNVIKNYFFMKDNKYKFTIDGMSCNGCVKNLKKIIMENNDVYDVKINFQEKIGIITTTQKFNIIKFKNSIEETKFQIKFINEQSKKDKSILIKLKEKLFK